MLVYPTIRGLGYPVKRTLSWESQVIKASSGADVATTYWTNPLRRWELRYDGEDSGYILDDPNNPVPMTADTDLVILEGFYNQCQGRFGIFLYDDQTPGTVTGAGPWDSVVGQAIGTGDGILAIMQLIRTVGGFTEEIQAPYTTPPPIVYDNGTPLVYAVDYTVDQYGRILFAAPPAAAHAITADYSYYWYVRFDEDNLEFENTMALFWANKSVKLAQVRI